MQHPKIDQPMVSVSGTEAGNHSTKWRWFFVGIASLLIVIVALGFAPSFYLRDINTHIHPARPKLPVYLSLHGIVLTAWYLLFFAQTWLVAIRRTTLHRALGIAGAVLAPGVFALSLMVVLRAPARDIAAGASVAEISLKVIGDIAILILFAVLVTLGIRNRQKPDIHKRLMAFASISIVAPAIARWPGAEENLPFSVVVPQLLFCAALFVYDLATRRRIHPATGWVVASYLFVIGISVPLAFSELGHRFVNALR